MAFVQGETGAPGRFRAEEGHDVTCFQSVPLTAVSKRRPRGWTQRNAETFKEAAAFTRVTGDGGSDLRIAGEN